MDKALLDALPSIGAAFDTETWLARPKFVPPLVCGSVATADGEGLLDKEKTRELFLRLLEPGRVIVGAFIAYDLTIMVHDFARRGIDLLPQVFAKLDRGEVYDVLTAEMLDAIAGGHLGYDPRDGGSLRDPATGKASQRYSLAIVCDLVLGYTGAKQRDTWRKRYAALDGIPLSRWPEEARTYPVDDARNTWRVALAQCGHLPRCDGERRRSDNLHAVADIVRAAFALKLGADWGFAVDQAKVDELEAQTSQIVEEGATQFAELGLLEWTGEKWKAPYPPKKRLVALAYGASGDCRICDGTAKAPSEKTGNLINCKACDATGLDLDSSHAIPRTPKGGVTTARDVLVDSGDDVLVDFGDWGEEQKTLTTYVPALRDGVPLLPNVPLANERVSYGGIVQTMPRGKSKKVKCERHDMAGCSECVVKAISVRECVTARPGYVLSSTDFAGVELCTWAQVCLWLVGFSNLAEVLNTVDENGQPVGDAHSVLGADLCGIPYDEFLPKKKEKPFADYRQAAKWGNFGFAGGMGEPKFVITNRKAPGMTTTAPDGKIYKGVRFCLLIGGAERCGTEKLLEYKGRPTTPVCAACVRAAETIRAAWRRRWTEVEPYFAHVGREVERVGKIIHFGSNVVRGGVEFCAAANGYFSSLAAVGAKRAFYAVARECYTDRSSPLWGSRPIAFIHDEAIVEHPEDRSHDAAMRVSTVMVAEMKKVVPDVLIAAEPALMRRLYKGAEPVYENRRLVPWEP